MDGEQYEQILKVSLFTVQTSRHSKLEKADILEMTVKHLRNLQRLQMTGTDHVDVSL